MKVLFLDIDGVLNNLSDLLDEKCTMGDKFHGGSRRGIDMGFSDEAVEQLRRIVRETECDIVISSTWRIFSPLDNLQQGFFELGIPSVIDVTPRSRCGFRGVEVDMWLEGNITVDSFAILDDDSDFFDVQPLVETKFQTGLTSVEADKIIAILNGEV